jgi:hypothetical protein
MIPNFHKIMQMAAKHLNQLGIKYIKILRSKAFLNVQKWGLDIPSANPASNPGSFRLLQFEVIKRWSWIPRHQGDQIGRIFAHWAIVYFGIFSKFYFCIILMATYSTKAGVNLLFLTKYGLDYILGDFFKKASCHPDPDPTYHRR